MKCADPRDRKVKRLLRKLVQRQKNKAIWFPPHDNLPVMSEVRYKLLCGYMVTISCNRLYVKCNKINIIQPKVDNVTVDLTY